MSKNKLAEMIFKCILDPAVSADFTVLNDARVKAEIAAFLSANMPADPVKEGLAKALKMARGSVDCFGCDVGGICTEHANAEAIADAALSAYEDEVKNDA